MKALTLTQPWATLLAIGAKTIETRGWDTQFRGETAIHAAKGFPDDARYITTEEPFTTALAGLWASELPTGAIIGVGRIAQTWRFTDQTVAKVRERSQKGELPPFEAEFGDYSAGRFGLRFTDVTLLPTPVPARGMLNLWDVPPDVENQVRAQLRKRDPGDFDAAGAAMVNAFATIDATKLDRGTVTCPTCNGVMRFARVGPKRHVRAACETQGCLRFMS